MRDDAHAADGIGYVYRRLEGEAIRQRDAMNRITNVGVGVTRFARRELTMIAGSRQPGELTQMLNLMSRLLERAFLLPTSPRE